MISEGSCDTDANLNFHQLLSAILTEINDTLKYITIENCYFKLKYYVTVLMVFLYIWSNKCRLDEHQRLFKNIKI